MTNENAIEILTNFMNEGFFFDGGESKEEFDDIEKEAFGIAIEALKQKHGGWIPLKWKDEETKCKILDYPYDGKWVIVTDGKNISVERIKIDAIDHFYPAGRWFELEDVVAWMPLPEPYQREGEAE